MQALATVIPSTVSVADAGTLPGNIGYLHLQYDGTYDDYKSKPVALIYCGRSYVRCSHNSDTFLVCYRTDFHAAKVMA